MAIVEMLKDKASSFKASGSQKFNPYAILILLSSTAVLGFYHWFQGSLFKIAPEFLKMKYEALFARAYFTVLGFFISAGIVKIDVSGDPLDPNTSAIFVSNHRSFADYAVLGHIAEKEDMHGRYNFFAWKRTFRLPDWRAGLKSMQLSQNWSLSEAEIYEVFSEAVNSKKPFWVFIFPEVNIISSLKIDQHRKFCDENGLPGLANVLYPRFPAFVQASTVLGSNGYKNIYDVTILYSKRDDEAGDKQFVTAPSILDFIYGKLSASPWYIDVYIERQSLMAINLDRRNIEKWLEKTWLNKEIVIQNYIGQQAKVEQCDAVSEESESKKKSSRKLFKRRRKEEGAL